LQTKSTNFLVSLAFGEHFNTLNILTTISRYYSTFTNV